MISIIYSLSSPSLHNSGILAIPRRRIVEESGDIGHGTEHRDVSKESQGEIYHTGESSEAVGYNPSARVIRHPARGSGGRLDVSG